MIKSGRDPQVPVAPHAEFIPVFTAVRPPTALRPSICRSGGNHLLVVRQSNHLRIHLLNQTEAGDTPSSPRGVGHGTLCIAYVILYPDVDDDHIGTTAADN